MRVWGKLFAVRPQLLALLLVALCLGTSTYTVGGVVWLADHGQAFIQPSRRLPEHIRRAAVLGEATRLPSVPDCQLLNCLALTFDDGPNPITTPQVLAELEAANIPATFFVVGTRVAGNEVLLRRMHADGDQVGNHSWSHANLTKLPPDQIDQQVQLTQAAVQRAGVPAPTVFRPPYGAITPAIEQRIPESILLWNEDPKDWKATTSTEVVQAVEASARPGGIVDMHDIYHVTADALPKIINDLTAQGYHFVTVDQLLSLTPASRGIYYGHPKP